MKIAIVNHGLPDPSSNGGPMTVWSILVHLLALQHEIDVVVLRYPDDWFYSAERRVNVEKVGARVHEVPLPDRSTLTTASSDGEFGALGRELARTFLPFSVRRQVRSLLRTIGPDAVFAYHWDSLAALHGNREWPKVGGVGDPYHLPQLRRWQHLFPRPSLNYARLTAQTIVMTSRAKPTMRALLQDCNRYGTFQAGLTREFQRAGLSACSYYRTSVVDPMPARRAAPTAGRRFVVLLGPSNLEATSTRAGIVLFATKILPVLEARLGEDQFVVRVVGEGRVPQQLQRLLPRPTVEIIGRIEPPDEEFMNADVQLVPTPFVLGIRVRIITGMSFGQCVVAHVSETENIPELEHGKNSLIGASGAELAEHLVTLARNPQRRANLGRAARETFLRHFHPEQAVQPILSDLLEVAAIRTVDRS